MPGEKWMSVRDLVLRDALVELLDAQLSSDRGEVRAEATVRTAAEREVTVRLAVERTSLGVVELGRGRSWRRRSAASRCRPPSICTPPSS